jgi:hypothetical protein
VCGASTDHVSSRVFHPDVPPVSDLSAGGRVDHRATDVTNLLRTVPVQALGHASSYHRVFSRRRWSTWALARTLITFLLDHVVPPGSVLLAGDDTVTEHPGPKVFGKGRHRDGVRSSHRYTAYRWGHKWVVVSVLVKLPFATRPWALPILVALYRPPGVEPRPRDAP